ncbi:MAG: YceH family protein [Acidobacteriota bacterium]
MHKTRPLDAIEIRVLGALMEKEQTTPDHYPLTINGVIAACNQKSNREPVMSLTETQVVEALDRLRQDVLTWRSDGARVERWQHSLDRRWQLSSATKAIMCMLLLRGPQSSGELKTRCQRMHPFASKEEVEEELQELSEGFDALVKELPRGPGQRDNRWTHLVAAEDTSRDASSSPAETSEPTPVPTPVAAPVPPVTAAPAPAPPREPSPIEQRLERLEATVAELNAELRQLRIRLGDLDE